MAAARDNVLTLDDILQNPNMDFVKYMTSDNDDETSDFFPYVDLESQCNYYDELSFVDKFRNNPNQLFMSINIQSLPAKFGDLSELSSLLNSNKCGPDVICLQETWRVTDPALYNLDNYNLELKSRSKNVQGGGVGLYIKKELRYKILKEKSIFVDKVFESIFAEIWTSPKSKIIVGSIYRPNSVHPTLTQTEQTKQFLDYLAIIADELTNSNCPVYLLGDFNLDLLKYHESEYVKTYIDVLFSSGFLQLILKPTRCTANTATLIDHIFSNTPHRNYVSGIITSKISDHFPTFTFSSQQKNTEQMKFISVRDFSEQNINTFKNDLEGMSWRNTVNSNDTQLSYNEFTDCFNTIFEMRFPLRKIKFNKNFHKIEKWITQGLLISRLSKLKLSKTATKIPSPSNIAKYKNYRNFYNGLVKLSKKMYFESELQKHQSDMKKTWEILNTATKKQSKKKEDIQLINVNHTQITDSKLIAENFNQFFSNIALEIEKDIPPVGANNFEDPSTEPNNFLDFSNLQLSNAELISAVEQIKPKHSPDPTNLPMFLIKKVIQQICQPLLHVINLSLTTGEIPTQLKLAKIVPIFKSGDPADMTNYRPISLLSSFGKILEKVVAIKLTSFVENNNLISPQQFGFRKNHSTVHPMMLLLNKITKSLNEKKHTIAIFCDLKKAFDTCDHDILLKKLSNFGIRGIELKWFENYLKGRMQFVSVNNSISNTLTIRKGVPQGSILGPLLFLIYINDLPNHTNLLAFLFADDTTLMESGDNINDLIEKINIEFQKITLYFRKNKLSLHPDKTKFLLFSGSIAIQQSNIELFINHNPPDSVLLDPNLIHSMERITSDSAVPAMKFLGVFFDPSLNFKFHVEKILSLIHI